MDTNTTAFARHRAQAHSWGIEAICKLARGMYVGKDDDPDDVTHEVIDGWFDIHSPEVEYIIDPPDGAFIGAILHLEHSINTHVWTNTSTGRTYCENGGAVAYVETDCTEINIFIENEYNNRFH